MQKLTTLAALTLVALTGCNTPNHIEGSLAVNTAVNVNAKQLFGSAKKLAVAKGTYKTSLTLNQDSATVSIATAQGSVSFDVPSIKADVLGGVNITAAQLGQEFSLSGKIGDSRDDIDRVISESCVHHYETQQSCAWENVCDNNNQNCHQEYNCQDNQVPVYGSENVHQVGYQDTKVVSINMVKAGKAVAKFSGSYTYNEDIQSSDVVSNCAL